MYCVHCGKEIEDDSLFCPLCGKKVLDDGKMSEKGTEKTKSNPVKDKNRKIVILAFCIVLVAVGALVLSKLGSDEKDKEFELGEELYFVMDDGSEGCISITQWGTYENSEGAFLYIDVVVKNTGDVEFFSSSSEFEVYADNKLVNEYYYFGADGYNFEDGYISSGRETSGRIFYDVDPYVYSNIEVEFMDRVCVLSKSGKKYQTNDITEGKKIYYSTSGLTLAVEKDGDFAHISAYATVDTENAEIYFEGNVRLNHGISNAEFMEYDDGYYMGKEVRFCYPYEDESTIFMYEGGSDQEVEFTME